MNKVHKNTLPPIPGINLTNEDVNILLDIQKLYLDYVQWVRNYLLSVLENVPGQSAAASRYSIQMSKEVYDALIKYISEEKVLQYLDIIYRFEQGNWTLATAYKNNDKTAIDITINQWLQVADEAAKFLYENFNNIDETQWKDILHRYLNLKIKEVNAFTSGNYDLEINLYDQIEAVAVEFATNMALGIIKKQHQKNKSSNYERV
jgi:hypothetical protein